jgi:hypothetical protein
MDFYVVVGRLRDRGRPDLNSIAARGKSERDQPRVVCDSALLRRVLAADDMPGAQNTHPPFLARSDF